eukprot:COSAG02_NODE_41_length_47431_cov_32.449204_21_plen_168_part_00
MYTGDIRTLYNINQRVDNLVRHRRQKCLYNTTTRDRLRRFRDSLLDQFFSPLLSFTHSTFKLRTKCLRKKTAHSKVTQSRHHVQCLFNLVLHAHQTGVAILVCGRWLKKALSARKTLQTCEVDSVVLFPADELIEVRLQSCFSLIQKLLVVPLGPSPRFFRRGAAFE